MMHLINNYMVRGNTIGSRDLKIGTHIQPDPGSNLVNVRTPGGVLLRWLTQKKKGF